MMGHDLDAKRAERSTLLARIPALDRAIAELHDLAGEVNEKLAEQRSIRDAAIARAGGLHFKGTGSGRTVTITDGTGTRVIGGAVAGTPAAEADNAMDRLDVLEEEGRPVLAALTDMQRERSEALRAIGLLGLEISDLEQRAQRRQAALAEWDGPIGRRLDWRSRLAAILRRLMRGAPTLTVQELAAEGKSVREIAEATGIPKSTVQRQLATGVPGGTADQRQGA